jgi:diguanylate cyclase (GGDEF)-like protein/PAS domain S-box-containing protein
LIAAGEFMPGELKILMLEDVATDAELAARELKRGGIAFVSQRVETDTDFREALETFQPDLILSDFTLPGFDGLLALKIAHARVPDTPFIFVSGTLGEETAVESLKRGATDYIVKDNLKRLAAAVERAIQEAAGRKARCQAEAELKKMEARFRLLVEGVKDYAIFMLAPDGRVVSWNPGGERITGYTTQAIVGRHFSLLFDAKELSHHAPAHELAAAASRGCFESEGWRVREDAAGFYAHTLITALRDEEGQLTGYAAIIRDITQQKQQEEKIARLSRIREVLSGINWAIVRFRSRPALFQEACRIAVEHGKFRMAWVGLIDQERRKIEHVAWIGNDDGYLRLGEFSLEEDSGRDFAGRAVRQKMPLICNDVEHEAKLIHRDEALSQGYRSFGLFPLLVEGESVGVLGLYAGEPGFFSDEELKLLTQLAADISFALDFVAKKEQVDYLAYYDVLTGLPNRNLFLDRLTQQVSAARHDKSMLAVAVLDVERFRFINDTLGRHAGDGLLKELASRLLQAVLPPRLVARIGADHFAVVLEDVAQEADVAHFLRSTLAGVLSAPFELGCDRLRLAAKCGIALYPGDGEDADVLFRNAEAALKQAKASGERFLFYTPEINARVAEHLRTENRLRRALEERCFELHYQPQFDLETGAVSSVEGLIRWRQPDGTLAAPEIFIPILEQTGMIHEAGRWALAQAVADCRDWRAAGACLPRISVNVSALQLRAKNFVDEIREVVQALPNAGPKLELELTESVIMENLDRDAPKLYALREMGVEIAIDDFGTGYSSLSYIARLPIHALKIDRSFVVDLKHGSESAAVVSTIIALAHSLSLRVVAEGVENQQQAAILRLYGCNAVQGFLYGPPIPAADISALLREQGVRGA